MKKRNFFFIAIFLCSLGTFNPAYSSESIELIKIIFSRNIQVKELKDFSETGETKGFLSKIIKNEDKNKIRSLLLKKYQAPIRLTSHLMDSEIGENIINRTCKIIYPFRMNDPKACLLATKSTIIKSLALNNEKISLMIFLDEYPSEKIAIDITELYKLVNKVESMAELIKFFKDSPLEKLKN